jgi:hypothetical protein
MATEIRLGQERLAHARTPASADAAGQRIGRLDILRDLRRMHLSNVHLQGLLVEWFASGALVNITIWTPPLSAIRGLFWFVH